MVSFPALVNQAVKSKPTAKSISTFVDMFCGIGGFHYAAANYGLDCVFACDIDLEARKAYEHNLGINPMGDIALINSKNIPNHDLFCAGFPCQPFSIMGKQGGFNDMRGTLFFEIARILRTKRPKAILLENVKQFVSHEKGQTLAKIIEEIESIGYHVRYKVLNTLDFGLPQKRERVFIVGFLDDIDFDWPNGERLPKKSLHDILEKNPREKYFASKEIREKRKKSHKSRYDIAVWHENKAGNISSYPYSCALRAGASHNYLLVNGERRLTEREMLRLQGYPDNFEIVCSQSETRKQAGNSISIPVVANIIGNILKSTIKTENNVIKQAEAT